MGIILLAMVHTNLPEGSHEAVRRAPCTLDWINCLNIQPDQINMAVSRFTRDQNNTVMYNC